jgi:hypothetical protein
MTDKVVMFMDFDGVLNWHGTSRNQMKKYADAFGYWRRNDVPLSTGATGGWASYQQWQRIEWSDELVTKLMSLKDETGYVWRWLTTWIDETAKLDVIMNIKSDGYVDWNPYPNPPVKDIGSYRCDRKLEVILDFIKTNPDTPFVWVDDEATKLWTPELDSATKAPHLIVTPWEKYGIVGHEFNKIVEFVKTNS